MRFEAVRWSFGTAVWSCRIWRSSSAFRASSREELLLRAAQRREAVLRLGGIDLLLELPEHGQLHVLLRRLDIEALPLLGVVHGDLRHVGHGLLDLVAELPVLALQRLLPLLVVLDDGDALLARVVGGLLHLR